MNVGMLAQIHARTNLNSGDLDKKSAVPVASLGDFGAIQAQAVAKIFILMRKSIPLERV